MKKRIIICGYPKSGNTWLTRLIAEIVECPVAGFWSQSHKDDIAIEGEDRISEFECYKAHHDIELLEESIEEWGNGLETVIYMVRDPRDIVISASHFFYFSPRFPRLQKLMLKLHLLRIYTLFFESRSERIDEMIDALLYSSTNHPWHHKPWDEHVKGFLEKDIHVVKYEELKNEPEPTVKKILETLGLLRTDGQIKRAIFNQNFSTKKRKHREEGEHSKAGFLRKGKTGQWKRRLNQKQLNKLETGLGAMMEKLGYKCSEL